MVGLSTTNMPAAVSPMEEPVKRFWNVVSWKQIRLVMHGTVGYKFIFLDQGCIVLCLPPKDPSISISDSYWIINDEYLCPQT